MCPWFSVGKDEVAVKWGRLLHFAVRIKYYTTFEFLICLFVFVFRQSLVVGKLAALRLKAVYAELEKGAKQASSVSKNLKA